jgi:hypothetical protein
MGVSLLALALAGCASPPPSSEPSSPSSRPSQPASSGSPDAEASGIERSAAAADLELVIRSPQQTWTAGDPIELTADLTYVGAAGSLDVAGSGSGLVGFSLEQVDGDLDVSGISTADCRPYVLTRDEPISSSYRKSGGVSPGDPGSAAIRAFLADPIFRLPAGSFIVRATFTGYLGSCDSALPGISVELPLAIVP